jgi:hypothetical protein
MLFLLASFTVANGFDEPEMLIPAKTKLSLELLSPISTATSKKGDKFSCKILTPAEFAGAVAEGHVRSVKRSGKADKESKIDLAFDTITLSDGRTANFSATVVEVFDVLNVGEQGRADNEGTIRNKSTAVKTSIKRAAVGALIGALVGGAVAGGQGAAVGAAIGASVGVTTTLATKGPDLEFKVGTQFTVETNGPSQRVVSGAPSGTAAAVKGSEQPVLRNVASAPSAPSSQSRLYVSQSFQANIPDNWRELSANPLMLGPDGAFRLNKGRPELTHGVMIGIAASKSNDLQVATEQLIALVLKTNSHLQRQGSSSISLIGGLSAISNTLSGRDGEGKLEVVTIHTVCLSGNRLFYAAAVVPEADADAYREAFNRVVSSIRFVN